MNKTTTLSVGDIFITKVPVILPGGIVSTPETHAGANITNAGQVPVKEATVELTVIRR